MQTVVDEGLASPILIGRPAVIEMRIKKFGLRLTLSLIHISEPTRPY